jgi:hypothetical protein
MGNVCIERHPWSTEPNDWFEPLMRGRLDSLRAASVTIGSFRSDERATGNG